MNAKAVNTDFSQKKLTLHPKKVESYSILEKTEGGKKAKGERKMNDCSKAEIYMLEKNRMTKASESGVCRLRCENCPLGKGNNGKGVSCMQLELKYPKWAIQIVQGWSNANPRKTYLSEFLRNYPKVKLNDAGVPDNICPHMLGLNDTHDCWRSCIECWNQVID